jgi:hypothetical protein
MPGSRPTAPGVTESPQYNNNVEDKIRLDIHTHISRVALVETAHEERPPRVAATVVTSSAWGNSGGISTGVVLFTSQSKLGGIKVSAALVLALKDARA